MKCYEKWWLLFRVFGKRIKWRDKTIQTSKKHSNAGGCDAIHVLEWRDWLCHCVTINMRRKRKEHHDSINLTMSGVLRWKRIKGWKDERMKGLKGAKIGKSCFKVWGKRWWIIFQKKKKDKIGKRIKQNEISNTKTKKNKQTTYIRVIIEVLNDCDELLSLNVWWAEERLVDDSDCSACFGLGDCIARGARVAGNLHLIEKEKEKEKEKRGLKREEKNDHDISMKI